MDPNDPRLCILSLIQDKPVNVPLSNYEGWLLMTKNEPQLVRSNSDLSDRLLADLEHEFRRLQLHKVEEWRRQRESIRFRRRLGSFFGSLMRPAVCVSVETGM